MPTARRLSTTATGTTATGTAAAAATPVHIDYYQAGNPVDVVLAELRVSSLRALFLRVQNSHRGGDDALQRSTKAREGTEGEKNKVM